MELSVSVVIPTHNRAKSLEAAVQSVLQQTFQDFEIIIINDNSTDDTETTLDYLQNLDKRIHVISNHTSMGGAKSRNQGIAISKGKWIAFLDDDDIWYPRKLEWQLAELAAAPYAVACSAGFRINYPLGIRKNIFTPNRMLLEDLLKNNSLGGASVCLASSTVLKKIGGFDENLSSAQDWDLWTRLRLQGEIISVQRPLVQYHVHFNYRISNNMRAKYNGSRLFYFKHKKLMNKKTRSSNLFFICYILSRQSHRRLSSRLKHLWMSVRHSPLRTGLSYALSSLPRMLLESFQKK